VIELKISDEARRALMAAQPTEAVIRFEAARIIKHMAGEMVVTNEWRVRFPDEAEQRIRALARAGEDVSDTILRAIGEGERII
jgi:hypothetical protein